MKCENYTDIKKFLESQKLVNGKTGLDIWNAVSTCLPSVIKYSQTRILPRFCAINSNENSKQYLAFLLVVWEMTRSVYLQNRLPQSYLT